MTFNARENSLSSGQPITLFSFFRGTQQWNYNSSDRAIAHLARTYVSLRGGIKVDGGFSLGGESGTDGIVIMAPADLDVATLYRGIPPSDTVSLIVYDRHFGDDDYMVSWVGEIQSVSWPAADRCRISCVPDSVSMDEQGLRLRWERACPHFLYERGCGVDRNLYAVEGHILSMTGSVINVSSVASYPGGYFNAGYVEWSVGNGNVERRAIENHSGTALTMYGGTAGMPLGRPVTAYPGCDQTPDTCHNKFGNMLNNGGCRHMPGVSPFDTNPFF